jgi:hypothetical protein
MRAFLCLLSAVAVIALGFWAYRENYRTQAVLSEVDTLNRQIGEQREALAVLRAEWAYLNRPDRLRDLAEMNYDRLGLLPFLPDQFGAVDQVGFPRPAMLSTLSEPVDVIGTQEAGQ